MLCYQLALLGEERGRGVVPGIRENSGSAGKGTDVVREAREGREESGSFIN